MSINLSKGQRISLEKPDGTAFSILRMGLGWDGAKSGFLGRAKDIDLDASCLLLDKDKKLVDEISYRQLRSRCGSIQHSGDNRTGAGEGDDETITINLANLPATVEYICLTINSFSGQSFSDVENASCRLYDDKNVEQAKFVLSEKGKHTALIMVSVYRHNGSWKVKAIGHPSDNAIAVHMLPVIQAVI